ncbi:MAG: hypothetical protein J6J43_02850 [Oscillospiraceae bacterium]|nr:hypothetical protein [Oscillospiraceae bacterium]
MVKVIAGLKGSGKTKKLIDSINTAVKTESGSMVCIEKGSALTFDIDYRVRLIDASEYDIGSYTFLKGFISGLHAGNFDISHIFIDGLFKLSGTNDGEETAAFLAWCEAFGEANKMEFTISVSEDPAKLPESVTKFI